jgi:uncharacterized membrane protein YdjX (TVP38/TMEM64 family)
MRWAVVSAIIVALILVPFFLFEDQFTAFGQHLATGGASRWYVAVGIAALLAGDVVLPVPSSITSAAAGALLGFWPGLLVIWVGMTVSCIVGYYLGARGGGVARRFVGEAGLARAEQLAARYGDVGFVICRPVPVLAEASVIFAGLVRAPLGRFMHLIGWSNLGIAAGYAAVGAFSMRADSFLIAFGGALLLPACAWMVARMWFKQG